MNAYNCMIQDNVDGLLEALENENLSQKELFFLLESAMCYKKDWAWPHLLRLITAPPLDLLYFPIVYRNKECFDTLFNTIDWKAVPENITHDLIKRCATQDDTYGFFKFSQFVPIHPCSNIVSVVVMRNNTEILSHILSHVVLDGNQQRESVIKAIQMGYDTCLDVLAPHLTGLTFNHRDIHDMMRGNKVNVDLLQKISGYFTKNNFTTMLHLACVEENEDVAEFAFPHAQVSKVLKKLDGPPPAILQEHLNRVQNKRILQKIKAKPSTVSARKM